MSVVREKFATQVDSTLLESLRSLAKAEGRQIQSVVEDALREHLDAKKGAKNRGREHVMAAYCFEYDSLGRCSRQRLWARV